MMSMFYRKIHAGLDPARSWPLNDTDNRLDITDADFVDIVHTNGGTNPDNRAIFNAIGHVDFYANGGRYQPGCQDGNTYLSYILCHIILQGSNIDFIICDLDIIKKKKETKNLFLIVSE